MLHVTSNNKHKPTNTKQSTEIGAEKMNQTTLDDIEFRQWYDVHYIKRNPKGLSKKIVNSKTERSFGVWPWIQGAYDWQPYNLISVRYTVYNVLF